MDIQLWPPTDDPPQWSTRNCTSIWDITLVRKTSRHGYVNVYLDVAEAEQLRDVLTDVLDDIKATS